MPRRFLHITFDSLAPDYEALEETFDRALDWYRYAPSCWVVWTSSTPEKWYSRLKKHLDTGEHVFICELNVSERSGWMPRKFWDFLKSHQ
jgi:hypothetical protein